MRLDWTVGLRRSTHSSVVAEIAQGQFLYMSKRPEAQKSSKKVLRMGFIRIDGLRSVVQLQSGSQLDFGMSSLRHCFTVPSVGDNDLILVVMV